MKLSNRSRAMVLAVVWVVALGGVIAPPVSAQMAVIDVSAIRQFVQQIASLRQQLDVARKQLQSTQGSRGMDQLLGNEARNYLPRDWQELESTLRLASATFGALGRETNSIERSNAVLNDETLARYSPREREIILAERKRAASLQAMTRQSLAATSQRFDSISGLVSAIRSATDQKAILDLSARIGAEQAMLANEQTKLQSLQRMAEADAASRAQKVREASAAGVGNMRDLPSLGLPH